MAVFDNAKYSLEELLDVERNIDREAYPERYQTLQTEIEKRKNDQQVKKVLAPKSESFAEPLAKRVIWSPMKSEGANFQAYDLAEDSHYRLVFKASTYAIIFYWFFILIGLAYALIAAGVDLTSPQLDTEFEFSFHTIVGMCFVGAGLVLFYKGTIPFVFDKSRGWYWKDRKSPTAVVDKSSLQEFGKINDIIAVQLIPKLVEDSEGDYYSFEVNLVLKDCSRVHVIDHGSKDAIEKQANKLSSFLDIPLWSTLNHQH